MMTGVASEETFARWFGEGVNPDAAKLALMTIDEGLRRAFAVPVHRSPSYTGILCWKKRYGQGWDPLPAEQQQLIRSTTTQGRFECTPVVDTIPDLYVLDLRLAYVASAMVVTGGREWVREERPAAGWASPETVPPGQAVGFLGWTPARYLVKFRVPYGWYHVGLLPFDAEKGWQWPDGSPWDDCYCATWADAAEVRLAIECGWHVEILERLYCTDDVKHYARPLLLWAQNLLRLRDDLAAGSANPDLYHTAIRNVILQAIGMFGYRPRTERRTVSSRDELPTHDLAEETYDEQEDGTIVYEDYARTGLGHLLHPEFAAAVWADTRVRLLRSRQVCGDGKTSVGALELRRKDVVGFGLDCIYSTINPYWPDDGRPGRWRIKGHLAGPLPAPRNRTELEALGKRAEGAS